MVTFHNRDPRPARPRELFRSGRSDVLTEVAALAQPMRAAGALTFEPAR